MTTTNCVGTREVLTGWHLIATSGYEADDDLHDDPVLVGPDGRRFPTLSPKAPGRPSRSTARPRHPDLCAVVGPQSAASSSSAAVHSGTFLSAHRFLGTAFR